MRAARRRRSGAEPLRWTLGRLPSSETAPENVLERGHDAPSPVASRSRWCGMPKRSDTEALRKSKSASTTRGSPAGLRTARLAAVVVLPSWAIALVIATHVRAFAPPVAVSRYLGRQQCVCVCELGLVSSVGDDPGSARERANAGEHRGREQILDLSLRAHGRVDRLAQRAAASSAMTSPIEKPTSESRKRVRARLVSAVGGLDQLRLARAASRRTSRLVSCDCELVALGAARPAARRPGR